ncbi:carcinoembryonic antigen-related cell adhesion molecule 1-like [Pseudorasbora parva]|uniref:carcinoembryonic antigen-related cell adhesion molecule 1-like n=1 Tax=Pseudorasbora parva TaxID=51549 RepID=UPI00351F5DC9
MKLLFILISLFLRVNGVSGADEVSVSVMEGDSVSLNTDSKTSQQVDIKWYYNNIRIAQIIGDLNKTCTDVQCNEETERFRDRLKLDNQTGSLTITNIRTEHSGDYKLQILSNSIREKIFNITVHGVSADRDEVKRKSVKEGGSVTLDPAVMKNTNDVMAWYHNDVLITEITEDQSQICADDQCKERFRDRLKLDHQTGSLNITHTRTSDSGDYKLEISSHSIRRSLSIRRIRRFSVTVTGDAVPGSGLSSAAVAGIVVGVLLVFAALTAAVIYYHHHRRRTAVPQDVSITYS